MPSHAHLELKEKGWSPKPSKECANPGFEGADGPNGSARFDLESRAMAELNFEVCSGRQVGRLVSMQQLRQLAGM